MTTLDGASARAWVQAFADAFAQDAEHLGDLDRQAGDGDFADNITSALTKAGRLIDAEQPDTYRATFTALARGFLDTGGTSGPLFGMFFRAMAKADADDGCVPPASLAESVAAGLRLIQERGGAEVGDSTLVDALAPASEALTRAAADDSPAAEVLRAAADAALAGARSTEGMTARRGRASYLGERARGVIDPGALAVAIFFAAGASAVG
jgi:dihydroxyacetone kinase-like protein